MRFRFQAILVTTLLSATAAFAAEGSPFSWQGSLPAGKSVEIKGVNGWIRAEAAISGSIEVSARRHGRKHDPNGVRVEVVQHGDGVTICAIYPDAKPNEPNECKPGKGGRMNNKDNDVQVEFTVKIPAGVNLIAKNVNGEVKAEGLRGDVRANTVNGDVTVSASGLVTGQSVNGSIKATMGAYSWNDKIEFSTVNGSIDVTLPAGASTELEASTVNGGVYSDFQMTMKGTLSEHHVNATIGGGGRHLKLNTVNGAIRIRQAGKTA